MYSIFSLGSGPSGRNSPLTINCLKNHFTTKKSAKRCETFKSHKFPFHGFCPEVKEIPSSSCSSGSILLPLSTSKRYLLVARFMARADKTFRNEIQLEMKLSWVNKHSNDLPSTLGLKSIEFCGNLLTLLSPIFLHSHFFTRWIMDRANWIGSSRFVILTISQRRRLEWSLHQSAVLYQHLQ